MVLNVVIEKPHGAFELMFKRIVISFERFKTVFGLLQDWTELCVKNICDRMESITIAAQMRFVIRPLVPKAISP